MKMVAWKHILYKETNTHDYFIYNSHHPKNIKRCIPFKTHLSICVSRVNSSTLIERAT